MTAWATAPMTLMEMRYAMNLKLKDAMITQLVTITHFLDENNDLCDYISCADDCGVPFLDNSSCTGCTIMGFCNYCPDCTINDFDSCIPFLDICSDESACNYSEDYYELSNFDENCVFYCEDCCEYPPLGMDCEGNDVDLQIVDWQRNKKIIKNN